MDTAQDTRPGDTASYASCQPRPVPHTASLHQTTPSRARIDPATGGCGPLRYRQRSETAPLARARGPHPLGRGNTAGARVRPSACSRFGRPCPAGVPVARPGDCWPAWWAMPWSPGAAPSPEDAVAGDVPTVAAPPSDPGAPTLWGHRVLSRDIVDIRCRDSGVSYGFSDWGVGSPCRGRGGVRPGLRRWWRRRGTRQATVVTNAFLPTRVTTPVATCASPVCDGRQLGRVVLRVWRIFHDAPEHAAPSTKAARTAARVSSRST